jgi:hypothetical protein
MNGDDFTKLFKYIQEFRTEVNTKLDEKASSSDMQTVLNLLDSPAKRQEISDDERLFMGHQSDRLNRWTQELASKIGYTLSV